MVSGMRSTSEPAVTPRYRGTTRVTSHPSRASDAGNAPRTSARPPVFENGSASEPMISTEDTWVKLYNPAVPDRPARPPRAESREVVELKQLRAAHPELASAIDMQLELVEMQRRVQARVPLPWIQPDPEWLAAQQSAGRPVVRFGDIPLDWSDFRLAFRQTADILHRYESVDRAAHQQMQALSRDGNALQPIVTEWYQATSRVDDLKPQAANGAP